MDLAHSPYGPVIYVLGHLVGVLVVWLLVAKPWKKKKNYNWPWYM